MCDPITAAILISTAVAAGTSVYTSEKQAAAQDKATKQAKKQAEAAAKQADMEFNKANSNNPDVSGLAAANQAATSTGQSSTMLTGAGGTSSDLLTLGKSTLLGQ